MSIIKKRIIASCIDGTIFLIVYFATTITFGDFLDHVVFKDTRKVFIITMVPIFIFRIIFSIYFVFYYQMGKYNRYEDI